MKLIIDIPDEQYNDIVKYLTDNDGNYAYSDFNLREIIRNGIPYNPTGDAISREALKENIKNAFKHNFNGYDALLVNEIYEFIDNAPSVPQVTVFTETADEKAVADMKAELQSVIEPRPKGEWVLLETNCDDGGNNRYECANCHYSDVHAGSAEVPYCWHCGAEMRKGGAENVSE